MNEALAELRTVNVPSEHHPPCRHPLTWMHDPVNWASVPVDSTGGRRWQSEIFGSSIIESLQSEWAWVASQLTTWSAIFGLPLESLQRWPESPHPTHPPTHLSTACEALTEDVKSCSAQLHASFFSFRCWFIPSTAAWLAAWVTWTLCISTPFLPPLPYFFFLWLFYLKCV